MDAKLVAKANEPLSRTIRFAIFLNFILLSVIMSGDNGVLSSGKKQVRKDLQLDEKQYGMFSSIPGFGRIIGSFIFMFLLKFDNRKLITLCCLTLNGSLFFVYSLTFNKMILFGVRALIGTVRIFPHIYIPVWVDQFGVRKAKTLLMTVVNITSPLGQTAGYILGNIQKPEFWYVNYRYVGTIILLLGIGILFFPSKYFSAKYNFIGYKEGEEDEFVKETSNYWKLTSYFENGEMKVKEKKQGSMLVILKKPVYVFSALTKAMVFFVFQIIHLNISGYAEDGLGLTKAQQLTTLTPFYSAAATFGPFLGGMTGGSIVTYFGGYDKKQSALCLFGFVILALVGAELTAFSTHYAFLGIGMFVFFFFASAFLPIIAGYVVSCIPKEHKGAGSSLNLLITNLLGNMPGPVVFGFLNDYFKKKNDNTSAWKFVIQVYLVALVTGLSAAFFRYRELSKVEEEEEGGLADDSKKGTELKEV